MTAFDNYQIIDTISGCLRNQGKCRGNNKSPPLNGSITGLSMSNSLLLIISCYGKVGYYPFFSVLSMLFYNTSYLYIIFDLINK